MAEANELARLRITKFNGDDFDLWKDKIMNALKASDCDQTIMQGFDLNEGNDQEKKAKEKTDEKAKLLLMSSISDDILRKLARNSAKDIWKSLLERYEAKNVQRILSLRRKLLNLKQEKNETVESFIDRVNGTANNLNKAVGQKIDEDDLALTILQGVSHEFEYFVQCLTTNMEKLKGV